MNSDSIRTLKHDLLSDFGSLMAAINIIKDKEENPEETKMILGEIASREDRIKENLNQLVELIEKK